MLSGNRYRTKLFFFACDNWVIFLQTPLTNKNYSLYTYNQGKLPSD